MADPAAPPPQGPLVGLAIGDVVADRYRVDAVLGEGGMGIVYRAEHLHLRKPLALKVLLPEWSNNREVAARFEREAVAAGNIESPHVVAATDFGRLPGGSFFLVMEYVEGRTLRSAVDGGALEPARATRIAHGIVSALHAAHAKGIIHRDLKPENVMLVEHEGNPDFVKVLDFGIAKVGGFGADTEAPAGKVLTQLGAVIGTPGYMSPEQALGQEVDARSDLYSVGVIFFEMLAGRCPFEGGAVTVVRQHVLAPPPELPAPIAEKVDPRVGAILQRLLAKAPEDRFAGTAELLAALDACPRATSLSFEASTAGTTAGARTASLRGRWLIAAAVAATFGTMALLGLAVRPGKPDAATAQPSASPVPSASAVTAVTAAAATPMAPLAPVASESAAPMARLPTPPTPSSTPVVARQPAPSSRAASPRPAPPPAQPRHTGPGGIYIPPPSQWFK